MNFSNIKYWTIPQGSVTRVTDSHGIVIWEQPTPPTPPEPENTYFYVEDITGNNNTISIVKHNTAPTITVYKSTDGTNWSSMGSTSTTAITATVPANGRLYLKATANTWGRLSTDWRWNEISCTGRHNVGGNVMSLLYGDNYRNQTSLNYTHSFMGLFHNDSNLVNANQLLLPATTLSEECYHYMFQKCTSLITAPALPATTLVKWCYWQMFEGCTSLTTAPTLPATKLAERCYTAMFWKCTSLNKVVTYANNISATNCLYDWLNNVAATGDFYNLGGATYPSGVSGIPTGWTEHTSL